MVRRDLTHGPLSRPGARFARAGALLACLMGMAGAGGWVLGDAMPRFLGVRYTGVRSKPDLKEGHELAVVYFGQEFTVLEEKDDWLRVRLRPREAEKPEAGEKTLEGWVHATVMARLSGHREGVGGESWLKAGGRPNWGAGLLEKEQTFLKGKRRNMQAVDDLEAGYPSAKDVEAFMQEGDLGLHRKDWPSQIAGEEVSP